MTWQTEINKNHQVPANPNQEYITAPRFFVARKRRACACFLDFEECEHKQPSKERQVPLDWWLFSDYKRLLATTTRHNKCFGARTLNCTRDIQTKSRNPTTCFPTKISEAIKLFVQEKSVLCSCGEIKDCYCSRRVKLHLIGIALCCVPVFKAPRVSR